MPWIGRAALRWLALASIALTAGPAVADETREAEDLIEVARRLESPKFVERELATQQLIRAGRAAVEPLEGKIGEGGYETILRGVYVLRELAMSGDPAAEQAAQAALERLSKSKSNAARQQSLATLNRLDSIREARASSTLAKLGGRIENGYEQIQFGAVVNPTMILTLTLDDQWTGTADDLRHLRWLKSIRRVVMDGKFADDAYARAVAEMGQLEYVQFKRTKITNQGLAPILELPNLQTLWVYYSPIGDELGEPLAKKRTLRDIRLYGTNFSPAAAAKLETATTANVDFRQGAFLGVGCDPTADICIITHVQDGAAAQRAGLAAGDVITKYAGTEITNFDSLRTAIGKNQVEDEVEIEAVRNGTPIKRKVKLGMWD